MNNTLEQIVEQIKSDVRLKMEATYYRLRRGSDRDMLITRWRINIEELNVKKKS